MRKMKKECIDFIFADPPFSIKNDKAIAQYNRKSDLVIKGYKEVKKEKYLNFSRKWIKQAYRVLKKKGSILIVSGWSRQKDILIALEEAGFHLQNELIFSYNFGVFTKRRWVTSHYDLFFATKDRNNWTFNLEEWYPSDVLNIYSKDRINKDLKKLRELCKNNDIKSIKSTIKDMEKKVRECDFTIFNPEDVKSEIIHVNREFWRNKEKTQNKLPKDLVKYLLKFLTNKDQLVLIPFLGSGTTGFVCKNIDRNYIGYELLKSNFDFALNRINNLDY